MKNNMKKNFIWNIIGTTFSAFNSLFFLVIVTRINGVDKAGVFSFAFSMACLFYIIGIYSGRVFQVTDNNAENDDYSYINLHIFTSTAMLLLAFAFYSFRGYNTFKLTVSMLLIIYKVLESISEVFFAIMQKNDKLYKVGFSMSCKAVISIVMFLLLDLLTKNLIISIISIVLTNLLFLVFYEIKNTKKLIRNKYCFNKKIIIRLFKLGFYTFVFTFLNLYLINIPKLAIENLLSNKFQTIFGIVIMPATVISLFAQFIAHPFLLEIKKNVHEKKFADLTKLIIKLTLIILLMGLICVVCAWLLGVPVLKIVYGINLQKYRVDLIIILVGATFYAITTIFANVLITFRKTLSQAIIYMLISIVSSIFAMLFVKYYGIFGASLTYLITMIIVALSFIILTCFVMKREKEKIV